MKKEKSRPKEVKLTEKLEKQGDARAFYLNEEFCHIKFKNNWLLSPGYPV